MANERVVQLQEGKRLADDIGKAFLLLDVKCFSFSIK
jgi:hypothetical protein